MITKLRQRLWHMRAIRHHRHLKKMRYRQMRRQILADRPHPMRTLGMRLLKILQFLRIPAQILILIAAPLMQRLRRTDWTNCEVN
ncbi:MAG: hypothetical protein IJW29_03390 [Clostridia bacterium]|nr:hypothetical protein [Clostridia bacterium]